MYYHNNLEHVKVASDTNPRRGGEILTETRSRPLQVERFPLNKHRGG